MLVLTVTPLNKKNVVRNSTNSLNVMNDVEAHDLISPMKEQQMILLESTFYGR
jgi:hypothetical protein